jgi:hypothetical protein
MTTHAQDTAAAEAAIASTLAELGRLTAAEAYRLLAADPADSLAAIHTEARGRWRGAFIIEAVEVYVAAYTWLEVNLDSTGRVDRWAVIEYTQTADLQPIRRPFYLTEALAEAVGLWVETEYARIEASRALAVTS